MVGEGQTYQLLWRLVNGVVMVFARRIFNSGALSLCCLLCGIVLWFLTYNQVLLIHRERRDDHKCHLKYGKDWEEYRRRVPSRIIPGVY